MSDFIVQHIWRVETGITDLPDDLSRLELASMAELRAMWSEKQAQLTGLSAYQDFCDRLAREWSVETGQIENLYRIERGVILALIETGFSAAVLERGSTDKPQEYVLALLRDQQAALEGLFAFVKQDRSLSTSYIKELHAAMTRSQLTTTAVSPSGDAMEVELLHGAYKTMPNSPVRGATQYHYCPPEHTASEMDRLVEMHLAHVERGVSPEVEAAWLHHRFTQIHPFQDGNGRVARALASLVLIRGGMFPMVVALTDKDAYLDALEAADLDDLRPLVLTVGRLQQDRFTAAVALWAEVRGRES